MGYLGIEVIESKGYIYYNTGNVGIGTATLTSGVSLDVNGSLLIRAFDGSAGGTKGIFFRDGSYPSTYKYYCSILTFDHSGDNASDGLSINAFDGVSFCTVADTREERMRIASNGNIGIGTNNPVSKVTINSAPGDGDHTEAPLTVTHQTPTSNTTINDPKSVLYLCRQGTSGYTYPARAAFKVCRFENSSTHSRTMLDIVLTNEFYTDNTIISFKSTNQIILPENTAFYDNNNKIRWLIWSVNQNYYFGGDNGTGGIAFVWRNGGGADGFIMYTNGNYSARGSYQAWSDIRIKKDIEDINDDTALQMILAIEPKTYKYIDGNKSTERVYGFIAQQVKEVIPEAVVFIETVIPNIYKNCICEDKRIYVEIPIDRLGRYIEISGYGKYKITKIEPDYIEVINDMHSKDIPDGENFVYGYEVKDFHTINKEYIFTLNVCATQELHRRIETQSLLIKSHEDRIKDLETKMERLLSSNGNTT